MEINQLKNFAIVASYENMTLAAKELHIAQPAISQSIARLEEELGVLLFDRVGKRIKLNRQGKYLLKEIPLLLEPFERIKKELLEIEQSPARQINILVLSSSVLIPELLKNYVVKYPNTKFVISQTEEGFDYDLCITSIPLEEDVVEGMIVLEEEIYLAIPLNNELARKKEIFIHDILAEDYITLSNKRIFTKILQYYFKQSGITPKTTFEAESPSMVRGFIEANLGIAFYPKVTWGQLSTMQVVLRQISDMPCGRKIVLKVPKEKQYDQSLKAFFEHTHQFYKEI